jgi:hypothetical protein
MDQGHRQDLEVKPHRPAPNIVQIMTKPFFQARKTSPSVDLSVTGETALHEMTRIVRGILSVKFENEFRALRSRTDKAHIPAQDVPELRQFVEPEPPQKPSNSSAARVVGYGPDCTKFRLRVFTHRSKLNDLEAPAAEADSNLSVEHRTAIIELDGQSNQKEDR